MPTIGIFIIFTLSGFAGLFYESLWSHYLKLILGHAAYAQTLVVGIFMGGLALGSFIAGRISLGFSRPLAAYAIVEVTLGLAGIVFHQVYEKFADLLLRVVLPQIPSLQLAGALKWILCGLLVLPQSVLLGMTFPLIGCALVRISSERSGFILSMLYFTNSIGAAAGVLVAGLFSIPEFGLPATGTIAGSINLVVGFVAWMMAKLFSRSSENELGSAPSSSVGTASAGQSGESLLYVAAAATGLASFCYEVGWIRLLVLVLGSSLQAFELMLGSFIFGLALGGILVRNRIDQEGSLLRLGGVIQILMGLAAALSVAVYAQMFDIMSWLIKGLAISSQGYVLFSLSSQLVAMTVMLPASIFAGMTLPVFTAALLRLSKREQSIGYLYSANTIGSIFGVFLATHVLLPIVGLKWLIGLGAAVDCGIGLLLLRQVKESVSKSCSVAMVGLSALALTVVGIVHLDPVSMASGVFRYGTILTSEIEVLFNEAGKTANVSVFSSDGDTRRSIATNGKVDGELARSVEVADGDESTMTLLAALPILSHPAPQDVAVVGFGTGMSVDVLLRNPKIGSVVTIEIEPLMVEGARLLGDKVALGFNDPRHSIIFNDARSVFLAQDKLYDIIISEPSNPWVSGVAGLFSSEFYEMLKSRLRPGGVLAQWLHLYEIDDEVISSFIKALLLHFPNVKLYRVGNLDVVLLASQREIGGLQDPVAVSSPFTESLFRIKIETPSAMAQLFMADQTILKTWAAGHATSPHSDYYPKMAYQAVATRYHRRVADELLSLHQAALPIRGMLVGKEVDSSAGTSPRIGSLLEFFRTQIDSWGLLSMDQFSGDLPQAHDSVRMLRYLATVCDEAIDVGVWRKIVYDAGAVLASRSPANEVATFWHELARRRCGRIPQLALDLEFLIALSLRDSTQIITTSEGVVASNLSGLGVVARNLVLGAHLLASLANKDREQISGSLRLIARHLPRELRNFETRFLVTFAIGFLQASA